MKDETAKLLRKAERALAAARTLLREGDAEFAAGRAYYAMLHAAQALLRESDEVYRKHSGVHSAFGRRFAKTGELDAKYHRWLLDGFDDRIRGDYDVDPVFEQVGVETRICQAEEFIAQARRYLAAAGASEGPNTPNQGANR